MGRAPNGSAETRYPEDKHCTSRADSKRNSCCFRGLGRGIGGSLPTMRTLALRGTFRILKDYRPMLYGCRIPYAFYDLC
ncbi:hypothetical protein CY34DRAFT_805961 [Suillus luteus UH-Slu-Lm8-n1]|uniref:Uncharacterized protein n=1 Tax=Suillus luteus UH-Slu-Lm8-n1 TaxID=930992 RepID=A0A0D0BDZ5_9AGAM|nr:hypothetical protein CY34DRAFT_805961 [Suillus luteus UH-Slu-Lm8-n1]